MFDFLRNLTKSAEEKRQEQLNAYLDNELSPRERAEFEQEMANDPALRAEWESLHELKANLQQLPHVRAPRNYTLDPAVYGQPASGATWQLYPALRVATLLTAFFFIVAVVMDVMTPAGALYEVIARQSAPDAAMVAEPALEDSFELESPATAMYDTAAESMTAEDEAVGEAEVMEEPAAGPDAGAAQNAEEEEQVEVTRVVTESAAEEEEQEEVMPLVTDTVEAEGEASEGAEDAADAAETMAAAAEATAAGDTASLAPRPTEAETEGARIAGATEAIVVTPVTGQEPEQTVDKDQEQRAPFPWLLFAEVALGVAFVVFLILALVVRRSMPFK